MKLFRVVNG